LPKPRMRQPLEREEDSVEFLELSMLKSSFGLIVCYQFCS
jgi:hypothetical protein